MRSLCIAEAYPWPSQGGYELRLANLISALASLGPVDFVCLDGSSRVHHAPAEGVTVIDAPESPELSSSSWMPKWTVSADPRRLVRRDFSVARTVLSELDLTAYDLCFYSHVDSWSQTHDLVNLPALLDFDNLENLALRGTRQLGPVRTPGESLVGRTRAALRWVGASAFNLVDERRWNSVQRRAAATVDHVLVCSELDVQRSGCANAVVIPNGYELDWEPADHGNVADPASPVFTFVGLMGYDPNIDAVRWFASDVLPRIRSSIPDAQFRVVGRGSESVTSLAALPGVTFVGAVEARREELDRADVSVIPIRSGAGTRLKVVEAMANRLPMVSTAVGCEGIDVHHGEHLLIAERADDFAAACVRLATERPLREQLITAAEQRFVERYRWAEVRSEFADLAQRVATASPGRATPG